MLSRELQSLGIAVYHQQVVGDNPQRMREALALALSRSDLVITTGGLGPTQDRSSFLPTFVFRPLTPPYVRFLIRRFLILRAI